MTEEYIKKLHKILKGGTKDSIYERVKIPKEMKKLLENYSKKDKITIEDIVEFHYNFETIHPFQDGNGRVGRLIMLKECLKNNIVPFVITENIKFNKDTLLETCKFAQDKFNITGKKSTTSAGGATNCPIVFFRE